MISNAVMSIVKTAMGIGTSIGMPTSPAAVQPPKGGGAMAGMASAGSPSPGAPTSKPVPSPLSAPSTGSAMNAPKV